MNYPLLSLTVLSALGSAFVSGRVTAAQDDAPTPPLEFPAASPQSTLTQRVGLTDVEVAYARPSAKGRKIFGGLVPFGEIWRTGANSATTVSFSTDVTLGGTEVPAGQYAFFTIPGEKDWTIILSKSVKQWGSYGYKQDDDLARITVPGEMLAKSVESLSFGISDLTTHSANLYFEWENQRVSLPIVTDVVAMLTPKIEAAMAADGERPYFQAAMFYFANGGDLKKSAEWIDEAIKAQPEAFWISHRKGLILEKMGDKAGAIAAAQLSLEQATKAGGAVMAEYVTLNEALIARCK